jgi:hypothetical protein
MTEHDDTTVAELEALAAIPGALKIITAEPMVEDDPDADLTSPSSFVCHDVVEIEGPDARGRYIAHSAEGDWTTGYPAALLARLRQWRG